MHILVLMTLWSNPGESLRSSYTQSLYVYKDSDQNETSSLSRYISMWICTYAISTKLSCAGPYLLTQAVPVETEVAHHQTCHTDSQMNLQININSIIRIANKILRFSSRDTNYGELFLVCLPKLLTLSSIGTIGRLLVVIVVKGK